jgi:hypothetical protein
MDLQCYFFLCHGKDPIRFKYGEFGCPRNGAVILLASKVGCKLASNANIAKRLNRLLGAVFMGLAVRLALFSGK